MTRGKLTGRVGKHIHIDSTVRHRLESLFETLCEFEQVTTRRASVIVVPHCDDEPVIVWEAGQEIVGADPVEGARVAMRAREASTLEERSFALLRVRGKPGVRLYKSAGSKSQR